MINRQCHGIFSVLLVILLISCTFNPTHAARQRTGRGEPRTLTVGLNETYQTIQAAIDDSQVGDTVFVTPGTYYEDLMVSKEMSLVGENNQSTIINSSGSEDAIHVTASGVNITGFTITGWGEEWYDAGIELNVVQNCNIFDNIFNTNNIGVYLRKANYNMIFNNNFINNSRGIFMEYSNNNILENNSMSMDNEKGIHIADADENLILNNSIKGCYTGIYFESHGDYNIIENNRFLKNFDTAIDLFQFNNNNNIINNTFFKCGSAFQISESDQNLIEFNNFTKNGNGIEISASQSNVIKNNHLENSQYDISIRISMNCHIANNSMFGNGIIFHADIWDTDYNWPYYWGSQALWNYNKNLITTHNIETSNTVKNKTVYFYKNKKEKTIPPNAGQIIIANCSDILIKDQNINDSFMPIQILYSNKITILNNSLSNNVRGLRLNSVTNCTIINNTFTNNEMGIGIYLSDFYTPTKNNSIRNNYFAFNDYGIYSDYYCTDNIFENNVISNNSFGAFIIMSMGPNYINNNSFLSNSIESISLQYCTNQIILNNTMIGSGIELYGWGLEHENSHIIENNTLNDRSIYYWKNRNGGTVPEGAGQIILANCTNINVTNQKLSNSSNGLLVSYSENINISDNEFSNCNGDGISIFITYNSTVANNSIIRNRGNGIRIMSSTRNSIENNNLSSNGYNGIICDTTESIIKNNIAISNNWNGINLDGSQNNIIINNTVFFNKYSGIGVFSSYTNIIKNNDAFNNYETGILIAYGSENRIVNNSVYSNNNTGINLSGANNNIVSNNQIYENWHGFFLETSSMNLIIQNQIQNNKIGTKVKSSSYNKIYHNNFIGNEIQAFDTQQNQWNHDYPYGGNYWSDYSGVDEFNGKGQDIKGSDGYGDEPYDVKSSDKTIDHYPRDFYPLMMPFSNISNIEQYYSRTPTAPQNINAKAGNNYVLLTWDPPIHTGKSPIIRCIIYRETYEDNGTDYIIMYNENTGEFNDTSVLNGQTYYYSVAVENWDGIGPNASINVTVPKAKPKKSKGTEQPLYRIIIILMLIIFALLLLVTRLVFKRKIKTRSDLDFTIGKTLKDTNSAPEPEDQEK